MNPEESEDLQIENRSNDDENPVPPKPEPEEEEEKKDNDSPNLTINSEMSIGDENPAIKKVPAVSMEPSVQKSFAEGADNTEKQEDKEE